MIAMAILNTHFFIPCGLFFFFATKYWTKQLVKQWFLAEGWSSRIAMQRCSSLLILFPFLLPASPPPPSFPSSLTWMRREKHEGKRKRGSCVPYWGSCAAAHFSPLSFLTCSIRLHCFLYSFRHIFLLDVSFCPHLFYLTVSHFTSLRVSFSLLFFFIYISYLHPAFSDFPSRSQSGSSYTFGFVHVNVSAPLALIVRASFHLWNKCFLILSNIQ